MMTDQVAGVLGAMIGALSFLGLVVVPFLRHHRDRMIATLGVLAAVAVMVGFLALGSDPSPRVRLDVGASPVEQPVQP